MNLPGLEQWPDRWPERLYTSRYQHPALAVPGTNLVPVRTTLYPPRFRLPYPLRHRIAEIAPTRRLFALRGEAFEAAYLEHLDGVGVETIRRRLAEVAAAGGVEGLEQPALVLLCFEDVWAGQACHRRVFADWYEARTGERITELPPGASGR